MPASPVSNGWHGFDSIGERVERGGFGHPPKISGWLYRCDGMPTLRGCGEELIVSRRLARVGKKKSGWLVCYGLEPNTPSAPISDRSQWREDHDVVLTFCPSCAEVVEGQQPSP